MAISRTYTGTGAYIVVATTDSATGFLLVDAHEHMAAGIRNDNTPSAEDIERLMALKDLAEKVELPEYRPPHEPQADVWPDQSVSLVCPTPASWRTQLPRPPPSARPPLRGQVSSFVAPTTE